MSARKRGAWIAGLVTATVLLGTTGMALTCAGAAAALITLGGPSEASAEPTLQVASLDQPVVAEATGQAEEIPAAEEPPAAEEARPAPEAKAEASSEPPSAKPAPAPAATAPRQTTIARNRTPARTGVVTMYRRTSATRSTRSDVSYTDLLEGEEEEFPYLDTDPDGEDRGSAEEEPSNDEMADELDEILEDFDPYEFEE
jgi:hypothetical protein